MPEEKKIVCVVGSDGGYLLKFPLNINIYSLTSMIIPSLFMFTAIRSCWCNEA